MTTAAAAPYPRVLSGGASATGILDLRRHRHREPLEATGEHCQHDKRQAVPGIAGRADQQKRTEQHQGAGDQDVRRV